MYINSGLMEEVETLLAPPPLDDVWSTSEVLAALARSVASARDTTPATAIVAFGVLTPRIRVFLGALAPTIERAFGVRAYAEMQTQKTERSLVALRIGGAASCVAHAEAAAKVVAALVRAVDARKFRPYTRAKALRKAAYAEILRELLATLNAVSRAGVSVECREAASAWAISQGISSGRPRHSPSTTTPAAHAEITAS